MSSEKESATRAPTDGSDSGPTAEEPRPWVVVNPTSGSGDHVEHVRERADERDYRVEETTEAGHATRLAREAAERGVDRLAVAGGDGTLHEVVQGLVDADALDAVTLGVVPVGTANIFAEKVGVTDVDQGFEVFEFGETRRIDLGMAGEEPFAMSCIGGLPAEVSTSATSELKAQFGTIAFFLSGLEEALTFDGLHLDVTAVSAGEETTWQGEAVSVLVGNVRRFVGEGGQANVEDGLLEVVIIEQMPPTELVGEAALHRLLGEDTEHVDRLQASQVEITGPEGEEITFSLDGELGAHDRLVLHTRPRALSVRVGPTYDPDPTP